MGFKEDLINAFESVGVLDADIIYIYSDFRTFGRQLEKFPNRQAFFQTFIDPFLERDKTIILTTFTYTTSGDFNTLTTPAKFGALNKWVLKQEDVLRSEHPLFSYAGLGTQAEFLTDIGHSAFGRDSIFDRLSEKNAAFLYLGRPISNGNTLIHYIEHLSGATYRIHKTFPTNVYRGKEFIGTHYSAFVRRRDIIGETFEFQFSEAAQLLRKKGIIHQVGSEKNFTNISCLNYDHTVDFLFELFSKDPTIFIKSNFI